MLTPTKYDKDGPLFSKKDITEAAIGNTLAEGMVSQKAKFKANDIDKATAIIDKATALFTAASDTLLEEEDKLLRNAKVVSSSVRSSTNKLRDGLLRIEAQANFNKLEAYVVLLERANTALQGLAALEQEGTLQKIAGALK